MKRFIIGLLVVVAILLAIMGMGYIASYGSGYPCMWYELLWIGGTILFVLLLIASLSYPVGILIEKWINKLLRKS